MSNAREPVSFEPGDKVMIDLDEYLTPSHFVVDWFGRSRRRCFACTGKWAAPKTGRSSSTSFRSTPNFRDRSHIIRTPGQIIGVCRSIHRIFFLAPQRSRFA